MASVSTHVLDGAAGGPRVGLAVTLADAEGAVLARGRTDERGRVEDLATGLAPGRYRLTWATGAPFLAEVAATVDLAEERHYHVPLLLSGASAVVYLGV